MRQVTILSTFLATIGWLLVTSTIGCGGPPDAAAETAPDEVAALDLPDQRSPAYVDLEETLTDVDQWSRWLEVTHGLRNDFDEICGDTFCEGDFANLQALSFRCSVSTRTGLLKSCLWLFAGSYETVTASTGNVRPVARFFRCAIPAVGTPAALMDALLAPAGRRPLWRPLPGGTRSAYDALGDCL